MPPDATGPVPAVVVVHEWWGLNDHIRHWADRLAARGYAALAVDLYDGRVATTPDEALAAMKQVDGDRALQRLKAAHDFLQTDDRVQAPSTGVIGWCFGGGWSLRLGLAEPELDAVVVYYGRLVDDPEQLATLDAPLLGIFGEQDKGIPGQAIDRFEEQLTELGKRHAIHRYPADHAFANPSSNHYDAPAADDAWGKVQAFLDKHLVNAAAAAPAGD